MAKTILIHLISSLVSYPSLVAAVGRQQNISDSNVYTKKTTAFVFIVYEVAYLSLSCFEK